jgi:hypothetical protein
MVLGTQGAGVQICPGLVMTGNDEGSSRVAQTINSETILGAAYAGFACAGLESTSWRTD